jgi:hypothetical protein
MKSGIFIERSYKMKRNCINYLFRILLLFFVLLLFSCPTPLEDIVKMSSSELIEKHTKGVSRARLTVGIVQNGQMSYTVYGKNGSVLSNIEHIYEIGSITKDLLFAGKINGTYYFTDDIGVTGILMYRRTTDINWYLSMFDVFAGISIRLF